MCTRSSLYFEFTQIVFFHSWMSCQGKAGALAAGKEGGRGYTRCLNVATHFEDLSHHGTQHHRRSLWEPPDQLVEKLFGCDLQVERVSAFLDERFEQLDSEECGVWVARVDGSDSCECCVTRSDRSGRDWMTTSLKSSRGVRTEWRRKVTEDKSA